MDWTNTHQRLVADKGNWSAIAKATGISGNQVRRIAHAVTKNPRLDTMQKVIAYYAERDKAAV